MLIKSLKIIKAGNSKFINQNHSQATYAKKIKKNEKKINWSLNANKVLGHIHSLSPSPGAWFQYKNERFKVLRAKISSKNGKAGSVIDENLTVGCDSNSIQILELQREGKNKQNTKSKLKISLPIKLPTTRSSFFFQSPVYLFLDQPLLFLF